MNRFDRTLSALAVFFSLVAITVGGAALHRAAGMSVVEPSSVPEKAGSLRIQIAEPLPGDEADGPELPLIGFVDAVGEKAAPPAATSLLYQQAGIELVAFVRPLVEPTVWWVQPRLRLSGDGSFEGTLSLGDEHGAGAGLEFEIQVLALPRGTFAPGDQLGSAPSGYSTSRTVRIKRRS